MARLQPWRRARGFTLVEVLVALAVMAVMALLTWRGIDAMVRAQTMTQGYTDDVLTVQAGLTQWRADWDALITWPGPGGGPLNTPAGQRSLAWNGSVLRLTRTLTDTPAEGVRVVAWARRAGDGQWLRWQSPPLRTQAAWAAAWDAALRWQQAGAAAGALPGGAQAVALLSATQWQLHYFRNNAWSNPLSSADNPAAEGEEGADQSDSGANTRTPQPLPDGVRLLLTLAPGQSLSGLLVVDWVRPSFGGGRP